MNRFRICRPSIERIPIFFGALTRIQTMLSGLRDRRISTYALRAIIILFNLVPAEGFEPHHSCAEHDDSTNWPTQALVLVPGARLELARTFVRHPLKMVWLPISPSGQTHGS